MIKLTTIILLTFVCAGGYVHGGLSVSRCVDEEYDAVCYIHDGAGGGIFCLDRAISREISSYYPKRVEK